MARLAHIVLIRVPYHETHRGNQRRDVFFCDCGRQLDLADLAVWAEWLALVVEGEAEVFGRLRQAIGTGWPCGSQAFVESMESASGV